MQLFSQPSIVELFKRAEFTDISAALFSNRYSLNYWLRLTPLPKMVKYTLQQIGSVTGIGQLKISVNVGNTIAAGFRPRN
jgi:hypothetical protein